MKISVDKWAKDLNQQFIKKEMKIGFLDEKSLPLLPIRCKLNESGGIILSTKVSENEKS